MDQREALSGGHLEPSDETLVVRAQDGDSEALETLIRRHQSWVYNLALRMVYSPDDAADVAQEAWLKVVTKISTFEGRSQFRTWLYRIVTNHVINMKTRPIEKMATTFAGYGKALDGVPDLDPPDERSAPADVRLMVEEAKISCMTGMLLCLDRVQRVVYVLGELFGVSDALGAEITGFTRDNFRQKLSRARRDLYQFMNDKCGLVKKSNPCRCARKTSGFVKLGIVDPHKMVFATGHLKKIRDVAPGRSADLEEIEAEYAALYREHPFATGQDVAAGIRKMLDGGSLGALLHLE